VDKDAVSEEKPKEEGDAKEEASAPKVVGPSGPGPVYRRLPNGQLTDEPD
jgi:hypothetical protein